MLKNSLQIIVNSETWAQIWIGLIQNSYVSHYQGSIAQHSNTYLVAGILGEDPGPVTHLLFKLE